MKRSNKRGFTLVELVIVIAVIAILAGVMIATFAGVVNDAKESAKLQEAQQAELAQKIEDVTKKLENPNWLTWEDFENELAEQLATINTGSSELTEATVKAVIEAALGEFAEKNLNKETGITEEQINAIVERTLSGSMTQAQVESIVKKYAANNLTANQVSSIVNAAMANSLTAAEVRAIVNAELTGVEADLETIKSNALTSEQIEVIVNTSLEKYGNVVSQSVNTERELIAALTGNSAVLVILNTDITLTDNLGITANATIDLAGKTLTTETLTVDTGVTVTIKNGTLKNEAGRVLFVKGNAVLEDCVVVGNFENTDSGNAVISVGQSNTNYSGVLTINGGTYSTNAYFMVGAFNDSTIIINDGEFNAKTPVAMNGSYSSLSEITINGGIFTSTADAASAEPVIYCPAGTLSIYGGEFNGESTIAAICGGTVKVVGGAYVTSSTLEGANERKVSTNNGSFADDASVFAIVLDRGEPTSYPDVNAIIDTTAITTNVSADKIVAVYDDCNEYKAVETIPENVVIK